MTKPEGKDRTVRVLDQDVSESQLKAPLREVLERRGLTAELILEDRAAIEKRADPDYADYGNIYKYAFF